MIDPFSSFGANARTKLLVLGSPGSALEALMNRFRSLNLEHVSPAHLMRREISRHPAARPRAGDDATLALLRRWFWSRKPDAGWVLLDFPATLLQAKVFDEWLEARSEALDAVILAGSDFAVTPVAEHYRTLGLLCEETGCPAT
jgi:adenylate kinase